MEKCNRNFTDRRKKFIFPPAKYILFGRRKIQRRETDLEINYYVDTFSPLMSFFIISITTMSIFDWFFTMIHLKNGAIEANPIMDIAINTGSTYSFYFKYILTTFGVLLLSLYKNFYPIIKIFFFIFMAYLILICYHIVCYFLFVKF